MLMYKQIKKHTLNPAALRALRKSSSSAPDNEKQRTGEQKGKLHISDNKRKINSPGLPQRSATQTACLLVVFRNSNMSTCCGVNLVTVC